MFHDRYLRKDDIVEEAEIEVDEPSFIFACNTTRKLLIWGSNVFRNLVVDAPNLRFLEVQQGGLTEVSLDLPNAVEVMFQGCVALEKVALNVPKAREIYLCENHIREVRGHFPSVELFNLYGNLLSETSSLPCLSGVKDLGLGRNLFERFDVDLSECETLDLTSNPVTHFSPNAPKLTKLRLADCLHLEVVELVKYALLERLDLWGSNIRALSGRFGNLETLVASRSSLEVLNIEAPKLEYLGLSRTRVKRISGDFPELVTLYASECPNLEVVDARIPKCLRLTLRATKVKFLDPRLFDERVCVDHQVEARIHEPGTIEAVWEVLPFPIAEEIVPELAVWRLDDGV